MKVPNKQVHLITAPTVEPVSLAETKAHLRIDGSDSDTLINSMIIAARMWVEAELHISLVQRTYRADLWQWYSVMELPLLPLSSITSIKYYNADSPQALTTLDSAVYLADLGRSMIYIDPNNSTSLPSISPRHNAVQVTYVCGYEPSADSPADFAGNVPAPLKAAILLQIGDLYERRETSSQLRIQELPTTKMLMARYREY